MSHSGPYRSQRPPSSAQPSQGKLECPGCLESVDDSLRICPRCGVPIATVRCASCFHMNPPSAVLCIGCGRELGLEPLGEPDALHCPDCKRPFQLFAGGPGKLHDCGSCGGQLVDHELLKDLLEQRELYGKSAPRRPPRHNPLDCPMRYVPCPGCGQIMSRRNFGGQSGVIVDICREHGTWFDRGELPRVLAFVEAGGLELARRRQEDEARASLRQKRVEEIQKRLEGLHGAATLSGFDAARREYELADASASLVSLLADLLGDR